MDEMVANLLKSEQGGWGVGGVLPGEPRQSTEAQDTYRKWVTSGAQVAAVKGEKSDVLAGNGTGQYIVEWAVRFDPCLVLPDGTFYNASTNRNTTIGFNLALGDLDTFEQGDGTFGHFHHETWLSAPPAKECPDGYSNTLCDPTMLKNYGRMVLMAKR